MKIIQTHPVHIEHLVEIILLKKKLHMLGAKLKLEPYNYNNTIEYFHKMFGYLDAGRIITYGVQTLTHHIELLKLLLKEMTVYLRDDEELFQTIYQLIQVMKDFLAEYSYDVSRHRIGHIGFGNKGYAYDDNAYEIRHTNSFHVYEHFLAYIMNAIQTYLVIKQQCADLLILLLTEQSQQSHDELCQEIQAFIKLHQEMKIAAHLVETVCQKAPDDATRHTTLQNIYRTLCEGKHNPILYGIIYKYDPESESRSRGNGLLSRLDEN